MTTQIHIEVGGLSHTCTVPQDLSPAEQRWFLKALCHHARELQLCLEERPAVAPLTTADLTDRERGALAQAGEIALWFGREE